MTAVNRKEGLLEGLHTTTPEQQRAAGLYAADRLGEDRQALAEVLEMLGLKRYDAPQWKRVHGPKARREAS